PSRASRPRARAPRPHGGTPPPPRPAPAPRQRAPRRHAAGPPPAARRPRPGPARPPAVVPAAPPAARGPRPSDRRSPADGLAAARARCPRLPACPIPAPPARADHFAPAPGGGQVAIPCEAERVTLRSSHSNGEAEVATDFVAIPDWFSSENAGAGVA